MPERAVTDQRIVISSKARRTAANRRRIRAIEFEMLLDQFVRQASERATWQGLDKIDTD